jgi:hypothetical protein
LNVIDFGTRGFGYVREQLSPLIGFPSRKLLAIRDVVKQHRNSFEPWISSFKRQKKTPGKLPGVP